MFSSLLAWKGLPRISLLLACLFQITLSGASEAKASAWYTSEFTLKKGAIAPATGGGALIADAAGKILFTLPTTGQRLHSTPFLDVSIDGPSPLRVLIYWESEEEKGKVYQVEVTPPLPDNTTTYTLGGLPGWDGAVIMLGLELHTIPGQAIKVSRVSLSGLSLSRAVKTAIHRWSVDRYWRHPDINFISGTSPSNQPPYPVPFFAAFTALALALLWIVHLLRRSTASFNWGIAGCFILFTWIVSDAFWQIRLWNQVSMTWEQFGNRTSEEKLLASQEAELVALTRKARQRITDKNANVFIASSGDYVGMISAYYMSPLNTYWHRKGPELPIGYTYKKGDYILMIRPSHVNYDRQAGVVHRQGEDDLKVRREYSNALGVLLKVI